MSIADDFPRHDGEKDVQWLSRITADPKYLAAAAEQAAHKLWDAGAPVWRADEKGIYKLHRDGTREYIDSEA